MHGISKFGWGCVIVAFATGSASMAMAKPVMVDQGGDWTNSVRQQFYVQDQGSQIMPLAWMQALKTPQGKPFLLNSLARFGYLPNANSKIADIPVGFTVAGSGHPEIGMTCSACHTRQIDVGGHAYRIDGGPAIVDFQGFLSGIDVAVGAVMADTARFDVFAKDVLGQDADAQAIAKLKSDVALWYSRYHTLIEQSLPDPAWGPSRLDAISMIFNRLTGLDIGKPPTYLIKSNVQIADAPTRYPFLWNASKQHHTQWPGFSTNGNFILGLARNLGEVYGVFAQFHPTKASRLSILNRDYLKVNSAHFSGLLQLERDVQKIGPPKWPWKINQKLAQAGEKIFNRPNDQGGCVSCHGIKTVKATLITYQTWVTPILDVGTDVRECKVLTHTVDTGTMAGAKIPLTKIKLKPIDTAFNVLAVSVGGTIIQNGMRKTLSPLFGQHNDQKKIPAKFNSLKEAFRLPSGLSQVGPDINLYKSTKQNCAYESRVLKGIWAAAPYLHNGSVPTLADLLKPAKDRPASFAIGPNYDIKKVGLAQTQTKFDYVLKTTDCSDVNSGNSRCGHEYGTKLSSSDKRALLEYLKKL